MVVRQSEGILVSPAACLWRGASWHLGVCDRWKSCTLNPHRCESGFTFAAHTQEKSIAMEAKLYVGNLPYTTVDADLQTLFSQAGTVKSAQVIRDRASGRSKGFGFVEMSSSEEAQSAITMFHGKDFSGRPLTVNLARPREDRPGGGGGGGFRNSGGMRRPGGNGDRERRRDY
jgi:RNA recognition motif-containing protein